MMPAPQNGGTDNGKRTPAKMDMSRLRGVVLGSRSNAEDVLLLRF